MAGKAKQAAGTGEGQGVQVEPGSTLGQVLER